MQDRALDDVLVIAGLAREARIASGSGVVTLQAGGRPEGLRAALAAHDRPARAVISFGIAGGLAPALRPGDVVIGTRVVSDGAAPIACDDALVEQLMRRLGDLEARVVPAPIAGVEAAVMSTQAKAALHARTDAAAVDMESHVAGAYATERALPFAVLRVVCDPAERALPAFAAQALKANGEPDIRAVLAALLTGKAKPGDLVRLARDSNAAFRSLGRARALLGLALGVDA